MGSDFFHVTAQLPGCRARECGAVAGVAASPRHRFSKTLQPRIHLRQGWGVENDAHAGRFVQQVYERRKHPRRMNQRQLHLISAELIDALNLEGFAVRPGELGLLSRIRTLAKAAYDAAGVADRRGPFRDGP
jgi:hypothetical protein